MLPVSPKLAFRLFSNKLDAQIQANVIDRLVYADRWQMNVNVNASRFPGNAVSGIAIQITAEVIRI